MKITRQKITNIFLVAVLLIIAFVPDAKALVLNGLMKIGLFGPSNELALKNNVITETVEFKDGRGNKLSLTSLKGKVVFINFWATWCPPCRAEMPSINSLYKKLSGNDNIVFITVDADGNYVKASKFLERKKYTLPLYTAVSNIPTQIFSGKLPTTIVIDKKGKIAFRHEGLADYSGTQFQEFLTGLAK